MRTPPYASLALFAAGFFLAGLFGCLFLPYAMRGGATRFAPGYSEFMFQAVHAGQDRREVEALLGPPLANEAWAAIDSWSYQPSDWVAAPHRTGEAIPPTRRLVTEFADIQFDAAGRVQSRLGDFLSPLPPLGASHEEVFARYGNPTFRLERPALVAAEYSRPAGTSVWKVRRVLYGADGKVFAAVAFTRFSAARLLPSISPFSPVP